MGIVRKFHLPFCRMKKIYGVSDFGSLCEMWKTCAKLRAGYKEGNWHKVIEMLDIWGGLWYDNGIIIRAYCGFCRVCGDI